jgi:hypothetical protein
MDKMSPNVHEQASDPHAEHKMSAIHNSHDRHAGHSVAMFRDKFWLSLALTIPVIFWSSDVQHWLGYTAPSFPGSKFIPAILGTVEWPRTMIVISEATSHQTSISKRPNVAASDVPKATMIAKLISVIMPGL